MKWACLPILAIGTVLLLCWGGNPPAFLLKLEVLAVCLMAMLHGFAGFNPKVPWWINARPVQGVACIYMGVAAMFIPLNFLASGWLLGHGIKLVMGSFPAAFELRPSLRRKPGDIVLRQNGKVATRD